jgi:hypothetical protein
MFSLKLLVKLNTLLGHLHFEPEQLLHKFLINRQDKVILIFKSIEYLQLVQILKIDLLLI